MSDRILHRRGGGFSGGVTHSGGFQDTHDANMERNLRKKKPLGASQTGKVMLGRSPTVHGMALVIPSRRIPFFCCKTFFGRQGIDVQVSVHDNNVDQAMKVLKKMQREGVFREMKLRRSYEKPSERKAREKAEAVRRARKLERKRLEREGS